MTQGREAGLSGRHLEAMLRSALEPRGFLFLDAERDGNNIDMFSPRVCIKNTTYKGLYGDPKRSEWLIADHSRKIRVECKWQDTSGSCAEKWPFVLWSASRCMPEREVLLIYGGTYWTKNIIDFVKLEASKITHKQVYVISAMELLRWVKTTLLSEQAAA